jgi:hypothetical protein
LRKQCQYATFTGMTTNVIRWECKCGVRIKVVTEMDTGDPIRTVVFKCPRCGQAHAISAERLVSVSTDSEDSGADL